MLLQKKCFSQNVTLFLTSLHQNFTDIETRINIISVWLGGFLIFFKSQKSTGFASHGALLICFILQRIVTKESLVGSRLIEIILCKLVILVKLVKLVKLARSSSRWAVPVSFFFILLPISSYISANSWNLRGHNNLFAGLSQSRSSFCFVSCPCYYSTLPH